MLFWLPFYLRVMGSRAGIWAFIIIVAACSGWWALSSFIYKEKFLPEATTFTRHLSDNPANITAVDSAVHLLKDGDLALRTGTDVISEMLRGMNLRDKTYSHCGIVMIENGYPFVYHSIGGEDNPDARLMRDSAGHFFSPVSNERLGIARLDLSAAQIGRLHGIAQRYYNARIPFDLDFDLATDDKLYCAEFVYKAVREAAGDTGYFSRTHLLKRTYVGVDNLYDPRHAHIICDVAYKL